jgi:ParB family chromosome partitioning protein
VSRRSGLGKGLGALIPQQVVTRDAPAYREIPVSAIRPNPRQPRTRFDEEAMSALAASIREIGVLQPVIVREVGDGEFELIAGERRWRAARRAGLQTIPALVHDVTDEATSLERALIENLNREDLNPLEEAAAYQALIDEFGYTHEQVAARVGRSRVAVTNTLRLLQLPAGVRRALAEGTLTAGHARALLGTPDRALQEALAERVVTEGLSVRAVEAEVRRQVTEQAATDAVPTVDTGTNPTDASVTPGRAQADRVMRQQLPPAGVPELEELLASRLGTRVRIELSKGRGRITIEFGDLEDLERIATLVVGNGGGAVDS